MQHSYFFWILTALSLIIVPLQAAHPQAKTYLDEKQKATIVEAKGILLLGDRNALQKKGLKPFEGVRAEGVEIPGGLKHLADQLKKNFLFRALSLEDFQEIKKTIILYYRHHNRPVVDVEIPDQDVTEGVIQVIIHEAKLGKVAARGNRYFSSKSLEKGISLKPGKPVEMSRLIQDLQWINRNPFREVDAVFTPGAENGTTDIDLVTKDRWPYRFYTGCDDTGLLDTGLLRWFLGTNMGNLWGAGHQFSYQFTTGTSAHEFYAHSAQYTAPLPWRHILFVFGGYSAIHAHLQFPFESGFHSSGSSSQASLRYEIPLWPARNFINEFSFGFDFKRTNNSLSFFGTPVFGKNVNISQLMAGYNSGYEGSYAKFNLTLEAYYNPGPLLDDESNVDFQSLRPNARNRYCYVRGSFFPIVRIPQLGDMYIYTNFRGQFSTTNLLASEQFGVGGYDTVRGYNENELNGDSSFVFNFELRSPQIHLCKLKGKKRDSLQFLLFFDYGKVWLHTPVTGEVSQKAIDSVGPGIRYYLDPYLTFRLDYGYGLKKDVVAEPPETLTRHQKWHFSLILAY